VGGRKYFLNNGVGMSDKPLPYKHIQDLTHKQLLQVMIDKLCCVSGRASYLLDQYIGAAAAYSLRKLSKDTTNVVRVRRSSDNAEQDFTDTEITDGTLVSWVGGGDGFVKTWYDQSGNANNATQGTEANQPKIVSSGSVITVNGYQVIQYDGSNDNLGTSLTATGTMLMGGSDGTAFYEVSISGVYNLLASASLTDHPLNETLRIIWDRSLSAGEKSTIESLVTYSDWDFSDVTGFSQYWRDRSELTSFPLLDVSSGTIFLRAWYGCSSLTSFPLLDFSSGTNFITAWRFCTSLTSFPANMFDSVTATGFTNAFTSTNLTQTSIDNILVSLDTAGQSTGTFNQSGGSAPSATGEAAIDNLRSRGWTVTVTGGY
jgi:hypothetical protein